MLSVRAALSEPGIAVATVSVPKLFVAVLSVMPPVVVDTFSAVALIAPVCVMALSAVNRSVPPTVALVTDRAVWSFSEALSPLWVRTVSAPKLLFGFSRVIAPLEVETFRAAALIAPV